MLDREFRLDIKRMDHFLKFLEWDLPIQILISLDYSPIYELLELWFREIVAHHHLENCEEFSVADKPVIINIIDLECKLEFLFRWGYTFELSLPPEERELSPSTNSKKLIFPSLFLSSTSMTRLTSGLFESSRFSDCLPGRSKNSFGSRQPDLSLSRWLNFL